MKKVSELVASKAWIYDPMETVCWDISIDQESTVCTSCSCDVKNVSSLTACASGFCRGKYCASCLSDNFREMKILWTDLVKREAVGLVNPDGTLVSEEVKALPLFKFRGIADAICCEDNNRLRKWCIPCFLASETCNYGPCGMRAIVNGNCMQTSMHSTGGGQAKRKRAAEKQCDIVQLNNKKLCISSTETM